jgi:PAS domain S-box-containing protein
MNYLYWNKKSEEYYGLKKEQVIGKNILEIFPRLLNDPSYNEFRRAMRGETVHITESGSPEHGYYYETYLVPVKNERGEVTAVLWITHDFSKEYRLLAEQKIAHEILDTVDEACFELDFESRLTYVNKKAEQLWNKSREELLHHNLWDIFPQAIDSPLYIAINTVLEDRVVIQQEFLSPIHDRWIYVMAKPSEKGVVILFLDIHELKQTQKKTVQVLNALNECYYELDKEYRITFMNKKAEQFFNKPSEEMTGQVLLDIFPQMKGTALYEAMVKTMKDNVPVKDVFISPLKGTNSLVSITPTGEGIAIIFLSIQEIQSIQLTPSF